MRKFKIKPTQTKQRKSRLSKKKLTSDELKRHRLYVECCKLNPELERDMAEESMEYEVWPVY